MVDAEKKRFRELVSCWFGHMLCERIAAGISWPLQMEKWNGGVDEEISEP